MQSNYYATQVYSEHPLALWPLDENVSYLSMTKNYGIDSLLDWTATNCALAIDESESSPPGLSVYVATAIDSEQPIRFETPVLFEQLDQLPVAMSAYVMTKSGSISNVEIGLKFGGTDHGVQKSGSVAMSWTRYSASIRPTGQFSLYVEVTPVPGLSEFIVYLSAVHAGELAENLVSLYPGNAMDALDNVFVDFIDPAAAAKTFSIDSMQYGFDNRNPAKILIETETGNVCNAKMLAKNSGVPMVYGTNNSLSLYESSYKSPSIIFPGYGFLHENGLAATYTAEFWMRQGSISVQAQGVGEQYASPQMSKFFGPMASEDGLYRDDTNMYLVSGSSVISYPVANWYRPMLIDICFSFNRMTLLVNGQIVGFLPVPDRSTLSQEAEHNYLGFWNFGVDLFEIDAFCIFPYFVTESLAKRRYATAQGTRELSEIDNGFLGNSVVVDYTRSNYNGSFSFPTTSLWNYGKMHNIVYTSKNLRFNNYGLPAMVGCSIDDFLSYNETQQYAQPSFRMIPDTEIRFSTSMFGSHRASILEIDIEVGQDEKILSITNGSFDEMSVSILNGNAVLEYGSTTVEVPVAPGRSRIVIDIDQVPGIESFASNLYAMTALFVGSSSVHAITFWTKTLFDIFDTIDGPLSASAVPDDEYSRVGLYTFSIAVFPNGVKPSVRSCGFWTDAVPLTHFAKQFDDGAIRLDSLQFNTYVDGTGASGYQDRFVFEYQVSEKDTVWQKPITFSAADSGRSRMLTVDDIKSESSYRAFDKDVVMFPFDDALLEKYLILRVLVISDGIQNDVPMSRLDISGYTAIREYDRFYGIGTKHAVDIYPANRYGQIYSPPSGIPIRITRETAPYLRLAEDSGIAIVPSVSDGEIVQDDKNCLAIAIGSGGKEKIAGARVFMALDCAYASGISNSKKILDFALQGIDQYREISIYVEPDQISQNAYRYALKAYLNGFLYRNILFFQDGVETELPTLEPNKWTQIAIAFAGYEQIEAQSYMNLYSGATFQNVSVYRASNDSISGSSSLRSWLNVLYPDQDEAVWSDSLGQGLTDTWANVYQINDNEVSQYYLDAPGLSNATVGTASITIDSIDDSLSIYADGFNSYSFVSWSRDPGTIYAAI